MIIIKKKKEAKLRFDGLIESFKSMLKIKQKKYRILIINYTWVL